MGKLIVGLQNYELKILLHNLITPQVFCCSKIKLTDRLHYVFIQVLAQLYFKLSSQLRDLLFDLVHSPRVSEVWTVFYYKFLDKEINTKDGMVLLALNKQTKKTRECLCPRETEQRFQRHQTSMSLYTSRAAH